LSYTAHSQFNWFSVDNTAPIISLLNQFADLSAQFRVDGAAFVSTFAGDGFDWEAVRSATGKNLFVVPNWQPTLENSLNPGINGLFSW
jgi:glucan endo-1,3-alpha-glucosidase